MHGFRLRLSRLLQRGKKNPTSSSTAAYVTAKQTFGTAPIVTVKEVAADDSAPGAYSLILPAGAPMLGQYATTLPIALVAQPGVAGKYTVEASATPLCQYT